MCSENARSHPTPTVSLVLAALLVSTLAGCGHKAPPIPAPLKNPARTSDLTVQQRGDQLILRFTHPQTTVSGLPLEPLTAVEYWEVVKPVPDWVAPDRPAAADDARDGEEGDQGTEDQTAVSTDLFSGMPGSGDDTARPDPKPAPAQDTTPTTGVDPSAASAPGDQPSLAAPAPPTKEELIRVESYEFAATARLKTKLEEPALTAALVGDRIVVTFPIEPPGEGAKEPEPGEEAAAASPRPQYGSIFAVKTAVSPRLVSDFSNLATIAYREPPAPPETFALEPRPGGVAITWSADADGLEGFHVYRRDAQSKAYARPLAFIPYDLPSFESGEQEGERPRAEERESGRGPREYLDSSAVFGERYIYSLTAVSNRSPIVESAFAVEREVDFADRFPPTPPRNPIALAEANRVRLLWDASPQSDVAGYLVYRSEEGGEFVQLFSEPIVELEYSDRAVRTGRSYRYEVVAVDFEGNESRPSQQARVRVP